MTDLDRANLDRILPSTMGSPDWDDVMSRARVHLRRRRRRVAVALAAAALVAVGTASAFGSVREFVRSVGFIGLPPQGAKPSAPGSSGASPTAAESGELVLFYWGRAAGNSDYGLGGAGKSRIWVYADGRLIFLREASIPEGANRLSTGFLEQRLTHEGVELLRSETLSTGLLGDDEVAPGSQPVPFGMLIAVRDGDRLVRVSRVSELERLVARVTDPASWLPASAWADREISAYVPSRYAVCFGKGLPPQPIDPSRLWSALPARAASLLRAKEWSKQAPYEAPYDVLRREPKVRGDERPPGGLYCSDATTEEARALAEALRDGGLEQGGPAFDRAFQLSYTFDVPGSTGEKAGISFEPYLPHGEWICSPCG
jgi:hypothetical protein